MKSSLVIALMMTLLVGASPEESNVKPAPRVSEGRNLTKCPDCQGVVSKRAVMCPHCGCPGEAIREAVLLQEELARPKAVVRVMGEQATGIGVAVREKETTFIVFDALLLANSKTLELRDVGTNELLHYADVRLAMNERLIRLTVSSDKVGFTPLAPKGTKARGHIDDGGVPSSAERAVAALASPGRICGIKQGESWIPLHEDMKWKAVAPEQLRTQLDLLARITTQIDGKQVKLSAEEASTKWLTPYLSKVVSELTR